MGEHQQATNDNQASCVFKACIPHLVVDAPRATDAIAFYKRAFGAEEVTKTLHKRKVDEEVPLVKHAHLKFGAAEIMLFDEIEECLPHVKSPSTAKGTSCLIHLETDDADAAFARALEAGAKQMMAVEDQSWGMRYGQVLDPFGFVWGFSAPLKEVHPEEVAASDQ